jgi:hypothetical protein
VTLAVLEREAPTRTREHDRSRSGRSALPPRRTACALRHGLRDLLAAIQPPPSGWSGGGTAA